MADFSLEDLKTLRERLGTGMVDTKNALVEADGDLEKAIEILRLKGAKGNAKRADRSTSEGLVAAVESGNRGHDDRARLRDRLRRQEREVRRARPTPCSQALADSGAETVDAALAAKAGWRHRRSTSSATRPRSSARRSSCVASCASPATSSPSTCTAPARTCLRRSASSWRYTGDDAETARSIAQHISFADPQYLAARRRSGRRRSRTSVASSRRSAAARASPRPRCPKIVEGRVGAFFKQVALLEQDYANDNKRLGRQGARRRRPDRHRLRPLQGRRVAPRPTASHRRPIPFAGWAFAH